MIAARKQDAKTLTYKAHTIYLDRDGKTWSAIQRIAEDKFGLPKSTAMLVRFILDAYVADPEIRKLVSGHISKQVSE